MNLTIAAAEAKEASALIEARKHANGLEDKVTELESKLEKANKEVS